MKFGEAVEHLYSLGNEVSTMKLGLENIRTLLRALKNPENNYLKVQVAGTNGKGSVCAFLNSICLEAGIKVGLYTSPHLVSITERVKINGTDISEDEFARLATVVRETSERLVADGKLASVPTFFEQVTAIALIAFAEVKVELAILETGLGGRLDATTAANAEIAAITRIDIDHQEYLGETLSEIAGEKAAIIHAGSRVVIGEQQQEAMKVILGRCHAVGVEPVMIGGGNPTGRESAPDRPEAYKAPLPVGFPSSGLGLAGKHQLENASVAAAVVRELREFFAISRDNILDGLGNARHPGRLESQGKYLFDGAHNVGGAKVLADYIRELETRPVTLIFAAMKDKNVAQILSILAPLADKIIVTEPSNSRSLSYDELLEQLPPDMSKKSTFATNNVAGALDIANEITPNDGIILITGSLYLVGEAKKILNN